jgi:hypothetical protein
MTRKTMVLLALGVATILVLVVAFNFRKIDAWGFREHEPLLRAFVAAVARGDSVSAQGMSTSGQVVHEAMELERHVPGSTRWFADSLAIRTGTRVGSGAVTVLCRVKFRGRPDALRFELTRTQSGWRVSSMFLESEF